MLTFTAAEVGSTRNEAARKNRVVGNVVVAGGRPGVSQFQERNLGIWGDLSAMGTLRDNEFRRNIFVRARPRAGADDGVGFVGFLGQPEAQRSLVAHERVRGQPLRVRRLRHRGERVRRP
ncbi:MAG: hypothetical protein ACKO91_08525 [Acidimicrobiales bacterium]